MCSAEAAQGAGGVVDMGAKFVGMAAGDQRSKHQQRMNKMQQTIFRRKAANAISRAREAGQQTLRQNAAQRGMARVNFAKSGVSSASGSAAKSLQDLAQTGRFSAKQQQHQGSLASLGNQQKVFDLKAQNSLLKSQQKLNRIQGGLSLLGSSVDPAINFGAFKPKS